MELHRATVIGLFQRYGFVYRSKASNSDFLAFTYRSGFFHNAELVSLNISEQEDTDAKMEEAVQHYKDLGFSTKKSFYKSVEDIESVLFDGFFGVSEWKEKIRDEYSEHSKRILNILPDGATKYEYIEVPYLINNEPSTSNIIERICRNLFSDGPQLTIVEAPAGFGKTCTSYEIINSLVQDYKEAPIPFFTEFSRDRQARVFSHILVKEVDRSFSSVNSEVVIEEVKNGKIAVVLDGFDEILHDSKPDNESETDFESAEPMLETIGELLTNNAKVILTSRRSAIFDGEIFNEWLERYQDKFQVNRYRLNKPEIKDWLQTERLKKLNESDVDIEALSNPVLLSYLRFVNDEQFEKLCSDTSQILDHYFTSMLEREMERQELRMNPSQQSNLLKLIANDMAERNYTSDSKDRIISLIKDKGSNLLNEVRALYPAKDKPTLDKLATTLSNHAFFDRSSQEDNQLEFVNEFVFGNYIALNVMDSDKEWIASDERFVEPAVLAFLPRKKEERKALWQKLSMMLEFIDVAQRMGFERLLTGKVSDQKYSDTEITSLQIKNIDLFKDGIIKGSIFNECSFSNTTFHFANFSEITFLNCKFWNCRASNGLEITSDISFYNCESNNEFGEEEATPLEEDISSSMTPCSMYILNEME